MREQFYRGAAARHIKCCLCVNNSIGVLLPNNNLFGASAAALYPTINRGCWPTGCCFTAGLQFYRGAADVPKILWGPDSLLPLGGGNMNNPFRIVGGGPDRHCAFRGARPDPENRLLIIPGPALKIYYSLARGLFTPFRLRAHLTFLITGEPVAV